MNNNFKSRSNSKFSYFFLCFGLSGLDSTFLFMVTGQWISVDNHSYRARNPMKRSKTKDHSTPPGHVTRKVEKRQWRGYCGGTVHESRSTLKTWLRVPFVRPKMSWCLRSWRTRRTWSTACVATPYRACTPLSTSATFSTTSLPGFITSHGGLLSFEFNETISNYTPGNNLDQVAPYSWYQLVRKNKTLQGYRCELS